MIEREHGRRTQDELYRSGELAWPISADEWETRARETLDVGPFDYIAGGAGEETTLRANREAFLRWRLRPRMLTGNAERSLAVDILGTPSPLPLMLAPIGVLGIAHPDGELAAARGAAAMKVPFIASSAASFSMEEIAEAMGDAPRWYQLYWVNDREVVASFVSRAEASGYAAIVVTLDTLTLGWRDRDLRNTYLPFIHGEGTGQFRSDPVFRARLGSDPDEDLAATGGLMISMFPNLGLTWGDLAWLREQTPLPIVVKGVLRADDARQAVLAGVDGIVVSNHGGRQVDGAVAALDALVEVVDEVGAETTVLFDSGIRRGADVVKALALGAQCVLLGRPYVYGLAVGGQDGVERVLSFLAAELDLMFGLVGLRSPGDLDRSFVAAAP